MMVYSDSVAAVSFLQIWLSYQALWDLQADYLYGKLGSGLECWMKALEDIKFVHLVFVCM